MSLTHAFYIPVTILVGLVVGYLLGARAAGADARRQQERSRQ